jgi:leader peptidase (prepilin peptidase)/N-methyltransferase
MLMHKSNEAERSLVDPSNESKAELDLNLAFPRSFCPACDSKLKWFDNIPVLSYILLKGKCKHCSARIALQYPFVEFITAALTLVLWLYFGFTLKFLASCIFIYALIALCFIDLSCFLLPDSITIPLIWTGLLFNSEGLFVRLDESLYGAVFGYLVLWAVYWVFKLFTGKEGFGYGDFKLLSALGAWLGWASLPMIILISTLIGSVAGLTLLFFKRIDRDTPIPFGPYLIFGGVVLLFTPQLQFFMI